MLFVCSLTRNCDAEKHYKIQVPSKKISFHRISLVKCNYEQYKYKINKTPDIFYLPLSLLKQIVFGIIHSMTITEICNIKQISLEAMMKIVCFARTAWCFKVATVTKNNSILTLHYNLHNRLM